VARDFNAITQADLFEVTDARGQMLAAVGRDVSVSGDRDALVREALAGRPVSGILTEPDAHYQVSVAPVYAGGRPVGALLLGARIGSDLADRLRQLTRSEVTFVSRQAITGSTLESGEARDGVVAAVSNLDQVSLSQARTGTIVELHGGGHQHLTLVRSLPRSDPRQGQFYVMQRAVDAETAFLREIQAVLVGLGVTAVLVALLAGLVIAERITAPVQRLVRGAEEMERGNYDYPLDVRSRDEIGDLAVRFDDMRRRQRDYVHNLREVARVKSEFISVASHELRTPISVIRGFLELMLHGKLGGVTPEQKHALEATERSVATLTRIAQDATQMAEIDGNALTLERADCDPRGPGGSGGGRGARARRGPRGGAGVDHGAGAGLRARGWPEPDQGADPSGEQRGALHPRRGSRRGARLTHPRTPGVLGERHRRGHRARSPAPAVREPLRGRELAPAPLLEHARVQLRGARARDPDRARHRRGARRPAADREPSRPRHHRHAVDPGRGPRADEGGGVKARGTNARGARAAALAVALLLALAPARARALEGPEIQWRGLLDVALAERGKAYQLNLLTRGDANFDAYGMRLFADGKAGERLQIFGQIVLRDRSGIYVEGAYATFTPDPDRDLHLLAGKLPWPIGTYAPRSYSNRNPLIGTPLMYQYHTTLSWYAIPNDADALLAAAGTGQHGVGYAFGGFGMPVVDDSYWDVGFHLTGSARPLEYAVGMGMGTPGWGTTSQDDNSGKTFLGRIGLAPTPRPARGRVRRLRAVSPGRAQPATARREAGDRLSPAPGDGGSRSAQRPFRGPRRSGVQRVGDADRGRPQGQRRLRRGEVRAPARHLRGGPHRCRALRQDHRFERGTALVGRRRDALRRRRRLPLRPRHRRQAGLPVQRHGARHPGGEHDTSSLVAAQLSISF
jgi:HAMP domain-containing protein